MKITLDDVMLPVADNSAYIVNVQYLMEDYFASKDDMPVLALPLGAIDTNYVGITADEPYYWRQITTEDQEIRIVSNHPCVHNKFVWEPKVSAQYVGKQFIFSLFMRNLSDTYGITFVLRDHESLVKRACNVLAGWKMFVPYTVSNK